MTPRLLVFDLDDTIVDTYDTLIVPLEGEAVRSAGVSPDLEKSVLNVVLAARRADPANIEKIIDERLPQFAASLIAARRKIFSDFSVEKLVTVEGAFDVLETLSGRYEMCLVSEGIERLQRQKIAVTGIAKFFRHIVIASNNDGKRKFLSSRLSDAAISPQDVIVIGNRLDKELRCGADLKMTTIWMRHGEGSEMSPADVGIQVNATIRDFKDLLPLLKS